MPVSPLLRSTGVAFPAGFTIKPSNRLIPASGMVGDMVPDTLMVGENVTIRDLNLFLALDHMGEPDLDMSLEGPDGTMHMFYQDWLLEDNADGVTTIFDESADSSMAIGVHTTFSPRIRPDGAFAKTFGGKSSQGRWILHVTDDQDFNTGRLTAWGLQFNNATATGVADAEPVVPGMFALDQNFPNPFNPSTQITYHVPSAARVRLTIFDLLGREVAMLVDEDRPAGTYRVTWRAAGVASGVYFYRLDARTENGNFVDVKRMLLLR
jgi:subtilisin-like proprotein convertase family protein